MSAALVTGASRGIGQGIALALARDGYDIAGVARRRDNLDDTARLVEAQGRRFLALEGDVSRPEDHARWLDAFAAAWNAPPDVLVNNAGVAPLERVDLLDMPPESFDRLLAINARGPTLLTQRVAKAMLAAPPRGRDENTDGSAAGRSIIFITSVSACCPSVNRMEYCVSKAGLSMAASCFAARLADTGIGVYEIRPGIIRTDMTACVSEKYDALISDGALVPQRRWGLPEDIGRACAALASGAFAYSTGGVFEIGGGMGLRAL